MSEYISLQGSRELTESEHYAEYQDTFEFQHAENRMRKNYVKDT